MARAACQRDASHQGVWKCSCEAGGDFCSSCILSHMGVQTGGTAHSVTPIATPVGQRPCGRCHGQPTDFISFNCEVCLCGACTRELSAPGAVRVLFRQGEQVYAPLPHGAHSPEGSHGAHTPEGSAALPGLPLDEERKTSSEESDTPPNMRHSPDLPHDIDEMNRQSEEALKEHSAAVQGRASEPSLLQRFFSDKKEGIRNSLNNALKEMENFEEIVKMAAKMESDLQRSNEKLEKLRDERGGRVGENEDLQKIVKRIEDVSRENEHLKTELQSLKAQHQNELNALNEQLDALRLKHQELDDKHQKLQEEHKEKVQDLKKQLDAKAELELQGALKKELNDAMERLQQSISDQSVETARTAAMKVTDVMPLISQVDLESSWIDPKGLEKFFSLAMLSIEGLVSSADMFQIARSCVRVAKCLGSNPLMADFAVSVSKRIRRNKETGLQFLSDFYGIYEFVREEKGKEVLSALLELLREGDLLIHAMEIIDHLRKLVKVQFLSDFTIAASEYFQQKHSKPIEWRDGLLELPMDWTDPYRAEAEECTTGFLRAVCDKQFSDGYLQLSKLLRKSKDPQPLFKLIEELTKLMKIDNIIQELQKLVETLLPFFSKEEGHPQVGTAFSVLNHLLKETEKGNVELLERCISGIYSRESIRKLVTALVRVLEHLSDKDQAFTFGFAVLKWSLVEGDDSAAFAELMMQALEENQSTLNETATHVSELLTGEPHLVLQLLQKRVSIPKVCEFAFAVLNDSQSALQCELLLSTLYNVAHSADQEKAVEWMRLTMLIIKSNFEAAVKTYQVYNAFGKRNIQDQEMAKLGMYILNVFGSSANKPLMSLLVTMERVLETDGVNYMTLQQLLELWRRYHLFLQEDPRSYEAISYFAERAAGPGVPELVTELKDTVSASNQAYASATLALVRVYMTSDSPKSAQSFITAALNVLKGKTEAEQRLTEQFIADVVRVLQEYHTFILLESIFRLKAAMFDQLFQLFTAKSPRLPTAFQILKHLLRNNDASELKHLADIITEICDSEEVAALITELIYILEKLQQDIIPQLGFAVLKCALRKQDRNVEFARNLLRVLEPDSPALREASIRLVKVLSSAPEFQSAIKALMERAVPTSDVCHFSIALLDDLNSPEQSKLFLNVLHDVATVEPKKVPEWMQLTKTIMMTRNQILVRTYEICSEFVRRRIQVAEVVEFGQFMLNVLQDAEINDAFNELLETLNSVLGIDGNDYSLLFRAVKLWTSYYQVLPNDQRSCRLICFFANNLEKQELPMQLEAFEAAVKTIDAATTLTVSEVFMPAYTADPATGQAFLAAALNTLRRIQDGGKTNNLNALVYAAVQFAQGREQAAPFLEVIFRRSVEITDQLLALFDEEEQSRISAAFGLLKHLLRDAEGQEEVYQLLAASIGDVKVNEGIKHLAEDLATVMGILNDKKDVISTLGRSVLRWAHEHLSAENVAFAQLLVKSLEANPQTLEAASIHVAKVLASTPEFQNCVQALIDSNIPLPTVCEFGSALLEDLQPPQWKLVLNTLHAVVKMTDLQEVGEWIRVTRIVMNTKKDATVQFYEMHNILIRGVQDVEAVRMGKYLLNVIHSPVDLEPLKRLLGTVAQILMREGGKYEVHLKILMLWRKYHDLRADDEQCFEILINFAERVGSPEVPALVTDLEESVRDANYASNSLALVKVYKLAHTQESASAQRFITAALAALKRMRDGAQRDTLKSLIDEAVREMQGPDKAVLLLSKVLSLRETIVDQLLVLYANKRDRIGVVFHLLKYLLRDGKLEEGEVQLIERAIPRIHDNDGVAALATALKPVLEKLKDSTEASKFGFGVLQWAFRHPNLDVELALRLLRALEPNSPTLTESSRWVIKVLSSTPQFQAGVKTLIERNVPTSSVLEFAVLLLDDLQLAGRHDLFLEVLHNAATVNLEKAKEWLQLTKSILKTRKDVVVKVYEAYSEFWRRRHQTVEVVDLVLCLTNALKSADISDSFTVLLNTLVQTLNTDGRDYELVLKIMKLWAIYQRLLPNNQQSLALATNLMERVASADIPALVTGFEEAVQKANGAYAAATLSLAMVYIPVVAANSDRAKGFVTTALRALKGLPDGSSKEDLEAFLNTLLRDFQGDKLFVLEAVFRPTERGAETLKAALDRLSQLLRLPNTRDVVKSLSEREQYEYSHILLGILLPNLEVGKAISKLLELATLLFENEGGPPDARALVQVVQQRPGNVLALLDPVLAMVGANPAQSRIADRLLQELSRSNELDVLRFIATLATDLLTAKKPKTQPQPLVNHLCNIFLDEFDKAKVPLQELEQSIKQKFDGFVELLKRCGQGITLQDINGFLHPPQPAQPADPSRRLAHIQSNSVRFFNFDTNPQTWGTRVEFQPPIKVYNDSSWTFLDNNRLFCCGGEDYAGYLSSSGYGSIVYSVVKDTYLLTLDNRTATKLQDMKTARWRHGILYYAPTDLVYVFGGSKLYIGGYSKGHPAGSTC